MTIRTEHRPERYLAPSTRRALGQFEALSVIEPAPEIISAFESQVDDLSTKAYQKKYF